jgi:hypothetical protein
MELAKMLAAGLAAAGLIGAGGCSGGVGGGVFSTSVTVPPQPVAIAPTVTADGTQQFAVPPAGRAVLRQKLGEYIQGPLEEARVSNAWRTAAAARQKPDDYAACVSATTGGQTRYFLIVVSGATTSGTVSGPPAAERCNDPNRVAQWSPFPEAMVAQAPGAPAAEDVEPEVR